jgi:hypothetical protein
MTLKGLLSPPWELTALLDDLEEVFYAYRVIDNYSQ